MALPPPKNTRRWLDFKYRYTADDGTVRITSDRVGLDTTGQPFIPITPMLLAVAITDNKTKLWGKQENLRKLEITYYEPRNQNKRGNTRRYVPYRPLSGCREYVEEVRNALVSKFKPSATGWCATYIGENRFTIAKPEPYDNNEDI
jgi:hypothetical protein